LTLGAPRASYEGMCNLYSVTKGQQAIREFTRAMRDTTGNLPAMPAIFPDMMAPIVRNTPDGRRELTMLRWGMPTPPAFLKGSIDRGVTNIRNTNSPHWRRWLAPENRCVVPATSFCEPSDAPNPATGKKDWVWFALAEDRPLFAFAGVWCDWCGVRGTKSNPVDREHGLFAFLTTEPNDVVKTVHTKAMPVILTTEEELELWMTAPAKEVPHMQRPLLNEMLMIVAQGKKEDLLP
jgi:putative SOS response-associated peptidase YedK